MAQTKIQRDLKKLADTLIDRDVRQVSADDDYTVNDVVAATHIFSAVFSNLAIKNGTINSKEIAGEFGNSLYELIKRFSGVDTKEYYKS